MRGGHRTDVLTLSGLALLAFVVRLTPVLMHGGLGFIGRYDDGVYYAAADALSFGRIPYKQFVLLHPPGIMLVLLPFAALGRLTTDLTGVEAARLAFMAIGAANTVLVALIARRWGRPAMLVAGVIYACWQPAVYAEQSTFLEPVGNLLVLAALTLLIKVERAPTAKTDLLAGVLLGAAVTVKIWYVVPLAVIVAWQLLARRPSSAARMVISGVAAVAAITVPFAVFAGRAMARMVLHDQLFRPRTHTPRLVRLDGIFGLRALTPADASARHWVVGVIVAVVIVLVGAALTERAAWPLAAIFTADLTVLLASPLYLEHYASYIAGPAALLVGIGAARLQREVPGRPALRSVLVAVAVASVVSAVSAVRLSGGVGFPRHSFAAAAPVGCVAADDPLALVEIDRLSSDFRQGCAVDVDVSGVILDRYPKVSPDGVIVPRWRNPRWQGYLYDYLTDAGAFIVCRASSDGMTERFLRDFGRFPLIVGHPGDHDQMRLGEATPS